MPHSKYGRGETPVWLTIAEASSCLSAAIQLLVIAEYSAEETTLAADEIIGELFALDQKIHNQLWRPEVILCGDEHHLPKEERNE